MSILNNIRRTILSNHRCLSDIAPKNSDISAVFTNRNPRNLEKLRIGYKPNGYHLDKPGRNFWHKLVVAPSGRYVTASIMHFENGEVITASTKEWALREQLYKTNDTAAYINLGRVLAQRCLESGLFEVRCDIEPPVRGGKVASLLTAMEESGIVLKEPEQFQPHRPWDQFRPEKPWEVTD